MDRLTRRELAAYGLLGLPLAMAALPLYVHLPKLYGGELGLPLQLVGAILLATRLADAVSDPVLGWLADRSPRREAFVAAALPLLALGMVALFHPPAAHLGWWLAAGLVVTYLGFSMASIAYQAWGAQLASDVDERTRVTAAREIFTLAGVVVAAAAPQALGGENAAGLARFSLLFAALLAACAALTLFAAPRPPHKAPARGGLADAVAGPLANPAFRRLLVVFVPSGIAAAIPSTLVLFFVADVLQAERWSGAFLVAYFLAGAAGMPLWVFLARRIGKRNAWLVGMLLAVVAFVWAYGLGPGDVAAFAAICVLSGLALGADLALPASILADVIDRDARGTAASAEGGYFGLWNLVTKANLALAAGIALPALAALGYAPGDCGAGAARARLLPVALRLQADRGRPAGIRRRLPGDRNETRRRARHSLRRPAARLLHRGLRPPSYAAETPKLALERYFDGTIDGWGMVQDRSGKVLRRFYVQIDAKWNGDKSAPSTSRFDWSDGTKERRIWNVAHTGEGTYIGTAADVVGHAKGVSRTGNALRWQYVLNLPEVDGARPARSTSTTGCT